MIAERPSVMILILSYNFEHCEKCRIRRHLHESWSNDNPVMNLYFHTQAYIFVYLNIIHSDSAVAVMMQCSKYDMIQAKLAYHLFIRV